MFIQGIDTSLVIASTGTPAFKVGTLGMDSDSKIFQYCKANGVHVVGDVVGIDEVYDADQLTATTSAPGVGAGLPLGVAVVAAADNEWTWIQVKGVVAAINVATSAAVHTILNTTASLGRIDDDSGSGAEDLIGITTTAAESGNLAAGILNFPQIGITG